MPGLYYARVIDMPNGQKLVAIADEEVMGVEVKDGKTGLMIVVAREFYGESLIGDEDAERLLEYGDVLVLSGSRIIGKAISRGLVSPESVLRIRGVEHVQVYKFTY